VTVAGMDARALTPGAMEHTLERRLADGGLIEFEQAPTGWLTKKGEPRRADWRAYFYTPPGGKRTRLPSVTTILDEILPKAGLPRWAEGHGIRGAVQATRAGLITDDTAIDHVEQIVRANRLGADAAKDQAADRGLNVHDLLRIYLETGSPPGLAGHPLHHHGFIAALADWLLVTQPEPEAIEELVADPKSGYAGRLDLRARFPRRGWGMTTVDAKTQEKAAIYTAAHVQVNLYEKGARACGDEPAERCLVVVFAADGTWREMPADHPPHIIDAALLFRRLIKPINNACETANRHERDARKPVAA
jgi:hypothetical protein